MTLIPSLIDFAPGTIIRSAEVDANFAAIRDTVNAYALFKDVSATITVPYTFSGGLTASTLTVTTGPVNITGNLSVTGNITLTGTLSIPALSAPTITTTTLNVTNIVATGRIDVPLIARPNNTSSLVLGGGSDGAAANGAVLTLVGVTTSGNVTLESGGAAGIISLRTNATTRMSVAATGVASFTENLWMTAAKKLFLDGGVDTYIWESAANQLSIVTNNITRATFATNNVISGNTTIAGSLILNAAEKLFFDGGIDSYIWESAANNIQVVAGASAALNIGTASVALQAGHHLFIPSGMGFYLDGGGDTSISEQVANVMSFIVGGTERLRLDSVTPAITLTGNTTITGNLTVTGTVSGGQKEWIDGWGVDAFPTTVGPTNFPRNQALATWYGSTVWIAPKAGSVTGVNAFVQTARTGGTLTVEVYINGVATGLQAILDATNTKFKATTQAPGLDTFVAGDEVLARYTTATFTPAPNDMIAAFEVAY